MRITIDTPHGPPFIISDRSDGTIRLERKIAGDGKRIMLFMDSCVARLIADGLHDIADELAERGN